MKNKLVNTIFKQKWL